MSSDRPQDVADIIAGLGADPTPQEIYHATQKYDTDYLASAAAALAAAGVGGSSPLQLLGPYTVSHTDLDPVDHVFLVALSSGTVILRTTIIPTQGFSSDGETVVVRLANTDEDDLKTLLTVPVQAPSVNDFGTVQPAGAASDLPALVGVDGAHLVAGDTVGSNTTGGVVIYCLAYVPT